MSTSRRDKGKAIASGSGSPPHPKRPRSNPSGEGGERRSKNRHDPSTRRFRDSKAAEDYDRLFKERSIVRDRAVILEGEDIPHPNVAHAFVTRGWTRFNHIMGTGYYDLTREFYANFRKNEDPLTNVEAPYTSFLRGRLINISEEILRSVLRIPEPQEDECRYLQLWTGFSTPENEERVQRVLECCCREGAQFELAVDNTPRFVKKNLLTSLATIWCHIVLSSLLPVKHATEIVVKRMVLIYCLMEDLYVDLPRMILSEMTIAATRKVHLPYCSVITQLAKRNKIDVKQEGGQKVQPELTIDRRWVEDRVYKGPVARRHIWAELRGEQPAAPAPVPPPVPQPTLKNLMTEVQSVKQMQMHTYDVVAKLTHQLANSLNFDPAGVLGDQASIAQWMASCGYTFPTTSQPNPPEPPAGADDNSDAEGEDDDDQLSVDED